MADKYPKIIISDERIASVAVDEAGGEVEWATDPPPGTHFRLTRCREDNENLGLTVITAKGKSH